MAPPLAPERRPRAKNRNAFVRTKVSRFERALSVGLVCLLVGIGVAIWIKGRNFDPGLYSLRTEALKSTASAVEGKSGTARGSGDIGPGEASPRSPANVKAAPPATSAAKPAAETAPAEGEESAAAGAAKPAGASLVKGEPLEIEIAGLKPMSDTEFYTADNLFEKIDGRAPAYTEFNCQQLRCRTFSVIASKDSFIDIYEYQMDTPINAFGIFAQERDPKGKPIDFAPDGYAGELGYYFRQGPRYVQVIASDQKPGTVELAKAVAENRAKALPVDNAGLDGRRRLPVAGLVPGSVTFVADNAQGQVFLKDVFQATYDFSGKKLPFFLMVSKPETAAAAWASYQASSARFGKVTPLPDSGGAKLFQAESFGTWKVIYQRNGELGGVFDADDAEKARQFVEQYLQGAIK